MRSLFYDSTGLRPWVTLVPILTVIFLIAFFITKCEQDTKLEESYKKEKQDAQLDSIIYTSKSQTFFYKQQAKVYADSVGFYKQKVATLDSLKKLTRPTYEKPLIQYRSSLATNPDSARKEFLSKRFPDLYPR